MAGSTLAQGFYLRACAGYSGSQAGQTLDGTAFPYSGNATQTAAGPINYDIKKISFSAGTYLDLAGGYMFSEHVGIDAAFNIGLSPKQYTTNYADQVSSENIQLIQKAANPTFFVPSLVLQTGGEKLNLYARVGLVVPVNTKITQDEIFSTIPASDVTDYTYEIKNSFSLGYAAAIGAQYQVKERLKLMGEVNFMSLAMLIKSADLTNINQDGRNYPPTADSSAVQHYAYSTNTSGVTTSSSNQAAWTQPFSNVGVRFGVVFLIGNQGEHQGRSKSGKGRSQNGYFHH